MLLGQDLGGRHQRALPARIHADGGGQRGDHGLARAHVALQQAVHGQGACKVMRDLFAHAALGGGELKGQQGQQLLVQRQCTGCGPRAQRGRAQPGTLALGSQLRQLLRQQLLGLQALPGGVAVVLQRGQCHVGCGVMQK